MDRDGLDDRARIVATLDAAIAEAGDAHTLRVAGKRVRAAWWLVADPALARAGAARVAAINRRLAGVRSDAVALALLAALAPQAHGRTRRALLRLAVTVAARRGAPTPAGADAGSASPVAGALLAPVRAALRTELCAWQDCLPSHAAVGGAIPVALLEELRRRARAAARRPRRRALHRARTALKLGLHAAALLDPGSARGPLADPDGRLGRLAERLGAISDLDDLLDRARAAPGLRGRDRRRLCRWVRARRAPLRRRATGDLLRLRQAGLRQPRGAESEPVGNVPPAFK